MNVRWSHCVLRVRDLEAMITFYCDTFGWQVADRGDLGPDQPIVFLSGSSTDHHQMALTTGRSDEHPRKGSLDHNAFRVDSVADVRAVLEAMSAHPDVKYAAPITHGNAVSVYFADPEGNGIEVFCDTPWHVPQPVVAAWNPELGDDEVLESVRAEFADVPGAMAMADYQAQQAQVFGEV